ncbi:hypothetical protein [Xenorhabdus griffiniae]|uniref:TetR family transcriptional regulator n=1 Tax=Xenorhabdus griffiniae TaxID=351672 RepID=A0ABY9XEU9_9GAMM|nr:hypothetical protein [Xenorhabdus griffiniae]MBD1225981.1 hypothetical protein [Xenorhabdus griffiniae]MBE8585901.1 hypothetical protein [Xenorhabdus griffiniae]WMV71445.1 hypothetical protein QL128_14895 [Xenorhabdus griffiniae]WNH01122.1 hypothetical protein QL112_014900 [Xenorhabdus griffiniae]
MKESDYTNFTIITEQLLMEQFTKAKAKAKANANAKANKRFAEEHYLIATGIFTLWNKIAFKLCSQTQTQTHFDDHSKLCDILQEFLYFVYRGDKTE